MWVCVCTFLKNVPYRELNVHNAILLLSGIKVTLCLSSCLNKEFPFTPYVGNKSTSSLI